MNKLLFYILAAILSSVALADQKTYVLFDVEVSGHGKKAPIYLAIERVPKGLYRLQIESHLLSIPAGEYLLDHIGFYEDVHGIGMPEVTTNLFGDTPSLNLYLEGEKRRRVKIALEEGYINYLGTLKILRNSSGRYELNFVSQESLLRVACLKDSDLIMGREIKMVFPVGSGTGYTVDCNRLTSQSNPTR